MTMFVDEVKDDDYEAEHFDDKQDDVFSIQLMN
jgi:hypothetical protein